MTSFAGTWNATLDTVVGVMNVVFNITESDGVYGGTAVSKDETVEILEVSASGNSLTWIQHVTTPMKVTLKFEVEVDGDQMKGVSKVGFLPASKVTATRAN